MICNLRFLRIVDVAGFGVNRGKRRHRADQHSHGVGVPAESLQKILGGLVQHGVVSDAAHPLFQLGLGGQLPEQNQVGHLEEGALPRQLLDRVAAVTQDALIAVDEGDRALA